MFIEAYDQYELIPLHQAFTTLKELDNYLNWMYESLKEKYESAGAKSGFAVVPLVFESWVPLRRNYWEGELQEFTYEERTHKFINFYNTPELFKMLVVPTFLNRENNTFDFDIALPFTNKSSEKDLELFMMHSDYPVNEFASHAALYLPGEPMRYNYETKKVEHPQRKSSRINN